MPSTIEQTKEAILKQGGKASKHQIARELKISLDYTGLILGGLKRNGEIAFSDGFYSLTSVKKSATQDEKGGKPIVVKPVKKHVGRRPKKLRSVEKNVRKSRASQKETSSLIGLLGISESLARTLEKAGYTSVESLADAPINKLMDTAKLKLRATAQLINKARKTK